MSKEKESTLYFFDAEMLVWLPKSISVKASSEEEARELATLAMKREEEEFQKRNSIKTEGIRVNKLVDTMEIIEIMK